MTAPPVLHLFPPVSDVERRRGELDDMIKKSMEMRPSRPFARTGTAPAAKRAPSRSRTRTPVAHAQQHQQQQQQHQPHYQGQYQNQQTQQQQVQPSIPLEKIGIAIEQLPTTHAVSFSQPQPSLPVQAPQSKYIEPVSSIRKDSMQPLRPAFEPETIPKPVQQYSYLQQQNVQQNMQQQPVQHQQQPVQQNFVQQQSAQIQPVQHQHQPFQHQQHPVQQNFIQQQPAQIQPVQNQQHPVQHNFIQQQSVQIQPVQQQSVLQQFLQQQSAQQQTQQQSVQQQSVQPQSVQQQSVQQQPRQLSYHPPPLPPPPPQRSARESTQPTEFDPTVVKTGPLPVPPIDTQNLKRSISRTPPAKYRPRRSSSARGHGRMSNGSTATRASTTISPVSSHQGSHFSGIMSTIDSPITNPSVYGSRPSSNFKVDDSRTYSQQFTRQSRQAFSPQSHYPSKSEENLPYSISALPPPPQCPPPRSSLRPSFGSIGSAANIMSSPPREIPSRASHRTQDSSSSELPLRTHRQQDSSSSEFPIRGRQPSQDSVSFSNYQSPVSLSRSNTITELDSPESYYMPEKSMSSNAMEKSIQSMFPTYDPTVPLQHQSYYPQRTAPVPPIAKLKHDSVSTTSRSSTSTASASASTASVPSSNISSFKDLGNLWNAANGQITTPLPGPFNLKMFKRTGEAKRRTKITFGPTENETFYSLAQAHPSADEEDEPHEALIFRHHATENEIPNPARDDLLPISHMLIYPPPAPSFSKASRHSPELSSSEPATQISTVTPVMATLHALDAAAKSPQAHALASSDPKAESPAAARLAERAVRAATERESCTLSWLRTDPRNGKYELHHPSLGVFTVVVEGDVKAALSSISSSTKSRKHASISLINPFASLAYQSPPLGALSPTAFAFRSNEQKSDENKPSGVLAKLDFSEELLHLDAPGIQSLGNVYLLDVSVSAILAVAVAESQRGDDPGLFFAAPPPSLMLAKVKKGSRIFSSSGPEGLTADDKKKKKLTNASTVSLVQLVRGTNGKKDGKRTIDWSRTNAIMGIEHLTDVNDLPRITRGILSVLGLGFKTALWLLEFGVRISAKMVIGLTKFADKV